jgi:putative mRNA 3-end processing factor
VALPPTLRVSDPGVNAALLKRALVLAPPSAAGTPWMRRFGQYSDAFASGWMQLRGTRRRRGVDRGFVMSDHADWAGLHQAIAGTGAERVFVTHGSVAVMVRWLSESGLDARAFRTEYGDEDMEGVGNTPSPDPELSPEEEPERDAEGATGQEEAAGP